MKESFGSSLAGGSVCGATSCGRMVGFGGRTAALSLARPGGRSSAITTRYGDAATSGDT
jgi:hypothetical protein